MSATRRKAEKTALAGRRRIPVAGRARWIAESKSGWISDFADLDLERYFEQVTAPLVVYGDLDELNNRFVQLRAQKHIIRVTGLD